MHGPARNVVPGREGPHILSRVLGPMSELGSNTIGSRSSSHCTAIPFRFASGTGEVACVPDPNPFPAVLGLAPLAPFAAPHAISRRLRGPAAWRPLHVLSNIFVMQLDKYMRKAKKVDAWQL